MNKQIVFSFLIALAAARALALDPLALAPFTFAGRIVDYAHIAYGSDTKVEVRVESTEGELLAKTTTATAGHTVYNYRLDIPVSNKDMPGYARVGDTVVFKFVDPEGKIYAGLVPAEKRVIGNPGEYRVLDVILSSDEDGDGVSDEYVDMISYLMFVNGKETYERDADWDGDGVSNYDEYVAGTNPFDATDKFSIRQMAMDKGMDDYVAVTFMVNQGRAYIVETTEKLEPEAVDWKPTEFSVADPTSALQAVLNTGALETGYRTIYLKKGDGDRRFWRLKSE